MNACVIFDLDDTLIDTRGVLLPASMARVSGAIGIAVERFDPRGKKIEELLDGIEGLSAAQWKAAAAAWYQPEVPPLTPLPGAVELLEALEGQVRLFLLTRGRVARQTAKVRQAGLGPYFEEVVIRPIDSAGSKRDDMAAILERCGLPAHRCAVVGDDRLDELRHARDLGCLPVEVPATPLSGVLALLQQAGLCAGASPDGP